MIEKPLTLKIIHQLYELACTPFSLCEFKNRWESFDWKYQPDFGDKYGFSVSIPNSWWFKVDPLGSRVVCASVPFYHWEDYDPNWHDDPQEHKRQQRAYNDAFETAKDRATEILPPPIKYWIDQDANSHKAVIWKGEQGILVLQQACFDPQFGIEVNFWLDGGTSTIFQPETPLIDYLCHRSRCLHDEYGFPNLDFSERLYKNG